jgi:hypothetical protein
MVFRHVGFFCSWRSEAFRISAEGQFNERARLCHASSLEEEFSQGVRNVSRNFIRLPLHIRSRDRVTRHGLEKVARSVGEVVVLSLLTNASIPRSPPAQFVLSLQNQL